MMPRRPPSPVFAADADAVAVAASDPPFPLPLPPLGAAERFFRVYGTTTLEKPKVSASYNNKHQDGAEGEKRRETRREDGGFGRSKMPSNQG